MPQLPPWGGNEGTAHFGRRLAWALGLPVAVTAVVVLAGLWLAWSGRAAPLEGPADRAILLTALVLVVASGWWAWRAVASLVGEFASAKEASAADAAAAADAKERLAGIIGSAMDAIITLDASHRIVVFNATAEQAFGWSASEMIGHPLDRLLPERFRGAHQAHLGMFAGTGETSRAMGHPGQLLALRRDGTEFPIEATISRSAAGGTTLLTVILRDISQRVRAEHEVREASERLARSAARLEGLQEIDRAILTATRLDQLAVAALVRVLPLVHADEADLVLVDAAGNARQHRVRAKGVPQASVIALPRGQDAVAEWLAGGMRVIDDLMVAPIFVPAGVVSRTDAGVRSYLGVRLESQGAELGRLELWSAQPGAFGPEVREIAREVGNQLAVAVQQAQLRDDLHRHAADLEERVAERTRALQDVNTELNSFAYSVSHDLRAPLRSTQGFAEALLEDYGAVLDETGTDYARRIVAASRRMDALIQDLLTYSRLSRAELELHPIGLGTLIRTVAFQAREAAEAASPPRYPEIEVVDPLPAVVGHRGVLTQVFHNLLSNALKFVSPDVVPRVRVTGDVRDGRVRVTVTDNGIGIAAEHHDRIFRVFERLHRLEAYPGTGIGLAIVRKGAERLGGRCGVESAVGGGSRFWVELPRADPQGIPPDADEP